MYRSKQRLHSMTSSAMGLPHRQLLAPLAQGAEAALYKRLDRSKKHLKFSAADIHVVGSQCLLCTRLALIERYQQYGVKDASHIFYDGGRHEPPKEFCRDQIHADVLTWLDARLS
jgi:alpha-beta hydrolase superfamily lysophospholipase